MGITLFPSMGNWAWCPYYATRAHIRLGVYQASAFCLSIRLFPCRGLWEANDMAAAVRDVLMCGVSKKTVAKCHFVPHGTLQRHVKNAQKGMGVTKKLGRHCILSPEKGKGASIETT